MNIICPSQKSMCKTDINRRKISDQIPLPCLGIGLLLEHYKWYFK